VSDAATAPSAPPEVRERLLRAWRGEIEAGAMYELIARRLPGREAEILRRMAAAEATHRTRLEARMRELAVEIPDPDSVRISRWARLQARLAPLDRLLHDIRKEERSHSMAVAEIRDTGVETPVPVPDLSPTQRRAKERLDKVMGRERWHQSGGGWISGAIYGANDGLAAVFGIVAGVSGATGGSSFVLTAGIAGAIASALSMATGAFLAERSEAEVAAANVERERREILDHPEEEKEELSLFYQLKGIDPQTADAMAEQLAQQPEAMLRALAIEVFGGAGAGPGNAVESAIAAGVSTGLGAIVPVIPFMFMSGGVAIAIAAAVSLVAHFLVGAAKSLVTLRTWWAAGLEMTLAGVIVGGATYLVGLGLPT
jgi:VIT1/CCC1 family predicted Fe2+/Mn2+ transporter/rubrerythrin